VYRTKHVNLSLTTSLSPVVNTPGCFITQSPVFIIHFDLPTQFTMNTKY